VVGGWLRDQLPMLLRLATAFTGSPAKASELVADALARDARSLDPLSRLEFPESSLRTLVVAQYLSAYRRRSPLRRPDLSPGLDALSSPRQRAAVVLRDGLRLTPLEIASLMDRSPQQIQDDLAAAPHDLRAEIDAFGLIIPPTQDVLRRWSSARRRAASRRLRVMALVSGLALVAVGAIAVPTVVLPRLPVTPRAPGLWHFSHEVRPAEGWSVVARELTPRVELTELDPPGASGDPKKCVVTVHVAGGYDRQAIEPLETTTVRGRDAFFAFDEAGSPLLAWEYGTDAWTTVLCSSTDLDRAELRSIASWVRFGRSAARLPFALQQVPAGYQIAGLTEHVRNQTAEVTLGRKVLRRGDLHIIVAAPLSGKSVSFQGEPVAVDAVPGRLVGGSDPRLCLFPGSRSLCLITFWPGGEWPEPAPQPVGAERILLGLARQLRFASDLADSDTWFEADTALPR
jgi:DNA-directed RNA polymerase specialized sigma24 family protein